MEKNRDGASTGLGPPADQIAARRSNGRATAEQLLNVAERLFSERGIDVVSLREVGKAASSRNTAAAQYHFGGKEGLIRAIIARRAPALNDRRLELLTETQESAEDRGRPATARELVRVLVLPLIEDSVGGSHYAGFLSRLAVERYRVPWVPELDEDLSSSFFAVSQLLSKALPGLDRRRFARRRDMVVQLVVGALAARRHAETSEVVDIAGHGEFVRDLLEASLGVFLAPIGEDEHDPRARPSEAVVRGGEYANE